MEEQERRQEILAAAFDEFANKGFHSATIKSIARAARLNSPSLIYWYFPTKEALFQEVLTAHSPFLQNIFHADALLDQPPRQVLHDLALSYFTMLEQPAMSKLIRLMLTELPKRQKLADVLGDKIILRVLGFLQRYLAHQIELGRLRPHDVHVSARAFMGLIFPQAMGKLMLPALRKEALADSAYLDAVIDIFLTGLAAPAAPEEA